MEPVNIICNECLQHIAVDPGDLGHHVECPLCGKVVQAPPAEPSADVQFDEPPDANPDDEATIVLDQPAPVNDSENTFKMESADATAGNQPEPAVAGESAASVTEDESIFEPSNSGEDIFGAGNGPEVELPDDPHAPSRPNSANQATGEQFPAIESARWPPENNDAAMSMPPANAPSAESQEAESAEQQAYSHTVTYEHESPGSETTPEFSATAAETLQRVKRSQVIALMLLIFLVPYAFLTTGVSVWLIADKINTKPDYLARMLEKKGRIGRIQHDLPVADHRKIKLSDSLKLGTVEIKPLQVLLGPKGDLILRLQLRNISTDLRFNPLPAKFGGLQLRGQTYKPYIFIETEEVSRRIYGAEIRYFDNAIDNQQIKEPNLLPGQSITAQLQTEAGNRPLVESLLKRDKPMLWRIQLRRGMEKLGGKERVITAVVGVQFRVADLEKQE